MLRRIVVSLVLALAVLPCLPAVSALAQGQYYPYGPPPSRDDYEREHKREEREMRREERERQKLNQEREEERRDWQAEEWRRHHDRYYGGPAIQPAPYESREAYAARVRAQCNVQWGHCANYCNTLRDPYQRAACVANCNNELYECQVAF